MTSVQLKEREASEPRATQTAEIESANTDIPLAKLTDLSPKDVFANKCISELMQADSPGVLQI